MGGIAGFALGGLLGSMLFGGLGGGLGGLGGGIGLLEIVMIGGAAFFLFRMFRARQQQPAPAYAGAGSSYSAGQWSGGGGTTVEAPPSVSDLDRGLEHIRGMDASWNGRRLSLVTLLAGAIESWPLAGRASRCSSSDSPRQREI